MKRKQIHRFPQITQIKPEVVKVNLMLHYMTERTLICSNMSFKVKSSKFHTGSIRLNLTVSGLICVICGNRWICFSQSAQRI
jgi:hypothetical protein